MVSELILLYARISMGFVSIYEDNLTHSWNRARSVLDFLCHVNSAVNAL